MHSLPVQQPRRIRLGNRIKCGGARRNKTDVYVVNIQNTHANLRCIPWYTDIDTDTDTLTYTNTHTTTHTHTHIINTLTLAHTHAHTHKHTHTQTLTHTK